MRLTIIRSFETNIKITGIVVLCIVSASILLLKMTEVSKTVRSLSINDFSDTDSLRYKEQEVKTFGLDIYTPPNYGAPDSQYGSGTR